MKKLISFLLVSLALPVATSVAAAEPSSQAPACATRYDVVIGVGDKAKVGPALANAANMQKAFGAACVNIEMVNYSSAVTMLSPMSPLASEIKDALKNGVHIVACQNSLNKFKLTGDDMFPGITTVPSGVAEIIKRQKQGYQYLNP